LPTDILVTGANGQLGYELLRSVPAQWNCLGLERSALDITDARAVRDCLQDRQPTVVINAAAYTAVDRAETEEDVATAVNALAPGYLASACREIGARLVHISTDFVFDGSACTPYTPDREPAPLGAYGRGKLAGEQAVRDFHDDAVILRTGWVYSAHGGNFVKTMLRLMGERDELSVVDDQVGTPTWAAGLAAAVWALVARPQLCGTYHWSDAGVCSWYDFAVAIEEEARALGLLDAPTRVCPIPAADYPTPARRPAYSVLDKRASWRDLELTPIHWRQQLRAMLMQVKEQNNG
jgi:dTDP-4-dehydrorhamnose reductase